MKPILRTVIDKNGNQEEIFSPSAKMVLYSIFRAENPGASTTEVCEKAGVDPAMPGRWAAKYGHHFMSWLEEALDAQVNDDAKVLERIGMINAVQGNFQFWREMARTKGVIKEEAPVKSLTINTDFAQILIAVGGDFNAARAKLLSAHRGVGDQGEPGLVRSAGGERAAISSGAGDRAGPVQAGPVAVPNALGADRGRAKQRESVPAVPEQVALTSTYEVLDE